MGSADELPTMDALKEAVARHHPGKPAAQHKSSVEEWAKDVEAMLDNGATPKAIYDRLKLKPDFRGSLSAIKRLCRRLKKAKGVEASDVAIPVETDPGDVAQVDFGSGSSA